MCICFIRNPAIAIKAGSLSNYSGSGKNAMEYIHSTNYIQTIRYQVNLANETVRSDSQIDRCAFNFAWISHYSASALDTYLQCPIEFYYRYIMRLQEKEEASVDLDNQDIGIFVHACFE